MNEPDGRIYRDPEGGTYRVRVAPREIPGGVSERVNSITFETTEGEWVGSAPLYTGTALEELTEYQLQSLLREARLRG